MPLVVAGVCRYALNQTYGDQDVVNILDMQVDTTGSTEDRDQALYEVAGDIVNNWMDHISSLATNDLTLDSISWVDLNSADGAVGSRQSTSEWDLPATNGYEGNPMPGNVCALVRKQVVGTRTSRNGRMFLAGVDEGQTAGMLMNTLSTSAVTGYNAALQEFLDGITDQTGPLDVQRQPVVVQNTDGPGAATYRPIEALIVQARLATQRRRLRD